MSQGWKTTWEQLERSQNDSVDDLLLRLLDANDPRVWEVPPRHFYCAAARRVRASCCGAGSR